jgi:hypothetical protein
MRRLIAALMVASGQAFAHPGHGAAEVHFHGWGVEHALLLVVVLAALAYALKK